MAVGKTEYDVSGEAEEQKSTGTGVSTPEETSADFEPAPDGGLRAWLVALGANFIFFTALGYASSFGVFQEYYMQHQLSGDSPDKIAWIGSLSSFLQFATGAFAGPAFDRFGPWVGVFFLKLNHRNISYLVYLLKIHIDSTAGYNSLPFCYHDDEPML